MGLRSINNPKSSFDDPYASTGLEAYLPSNAYITGAWYGTYGIWAGGFRGAGGGDGTTNLIQYVTIANTGNAASGGSLTQARQYLVGCSNGTRGLYMGGVAGNGVTDFNIIDYLTCATPDGNATDFGDLTLKRAGVAAGCDGVRALCMGGYDAGNYQNIIDYVAVAITGNATDFGDLSTGAQSPTGTNDDTRGLFAGRESPFSNVIQYITIATTGNSTDAGDLTRSVGAAAACSNGTRAVFAGGNLGGGPRSNVIDYVTIQTTNNATDFGDLTQSVQGCEGNDNSDGRGVVGGGWVGSSSNVIEYFDIATPGNATDFGDLTVSREYTAPAANGARGTWSGGSDGNGGTNHNEIDYVTISTTGNATDFGDLTDPSFLLAGTSGDS